MSYEPIEYTQEKNLILAASTFPHMRFGHWHIDLESRGFYVPNCNIEGKKIIASSENGKFCYTVDGIQIGGSSFWYNNWQPTYPKDARPLCGSYTSVNKKDISRWLNLNDTKNGYLYICKAKVLISEDEFGAFNEQIFKFNIKQALV